MATGFGRAFADGFAEAAGEEFAVQIPDGEAVGLGIELGMVAGLGAERVEIGDQMAAHAVGVDHLHDRPLPWRFRRSARRSCRAARGWRSVSQRTGWCGMRRWLKTSS